MKEKKILNIKGTMLDKHQLESHLEKVAASHHVTSKSKKNTYPIPEVLDSFSVIEEVYQMLNEHVKLGIHIHPAGEWLLDNFYMIEEIVKQIQKEMTLKKYTNFVGIANGEREGFARIYVLASEIVAYTDNKIEKESLEDYLKSYQTKKTLSMDEIWNIGIFLQIALIQKMKDICENIFRAQIQKYHVENIVERLIDEKNKTELQFGKRISAKHIEKEIFQDMHYPFIEYMSYALKRYGKKGYGYLKVLEETVEKLGVSVSEVIQKEHFEIAVQKVLIGNCINSIKRIQRINFLEIFEKINGVEDILRQDPAGVYANMDLKTKEYYRGKIKEVSDKTKVSEIYIAKKMLGLAKEQEDDVKNKRNHIGYYLIDQGINQLYDVLEYKTSREMKPKDKVKIYVFGNILLSIIFSLLLSMFVYQTISVLWIGIVSFFVFFIPVSEFSIQLIQYILNKFVKPKLIPKLDFSNGIDEKHKTMVVIPTIVKSKEKVREMMEKLEVYYLANQSANIYFTLLGDCSESKQKEEPFDKDVIEEGTRMANQLNEKYAKDTTPIFYFIYRERSWNEKEGSYLGWERKRGLLNQFNEYLLEHIDNPFLTNTIEKQRIEMTEQRLKDIRYIITLDADTDLVLNSAFELVGAMAHILNLPVIDKEKNIVVDGYGIMQPRVGINLEICYQTLFTKIFAGAGGIDLYTNAVSDIYQDNFKEGIFTGKGIYDLAVFSKVLRKAIPENKVLSHDLLEGSYLRCGLVSDIMLMDGYPTKYTSFMTRLGRWIRGDWQITKWLSKQVPTREGKVKNPLNLLSKYKIADNLRRSVWEASILFSFAYLVVLSYCYSVSFLGIFSMIVLILILPFLLELLNQMVFRREGEEKQKTFTPKISGIKGTFLRAVLTIGCLPYKVYVSVKAIGKTCYRLWISKKHFLEWTTSEEAEKQAKTDLVSYYKAMFFNVMLGLVAIGISIHKIGVYSLLLGILWLITPWIMYLISQEKEKKQVIQTLDKSEKEYLLKVAKKTWLFFEAFLTEKNNYLIPDNWQEDRREKIVKRTSSTNIGLSLLAVISAYDLRFISLESCLSLLNKMILTIETLPKWNGHLYNWYEIETKEPLMPRYISTVDSGNFVGYAYVTKAFLTKQKEEEEKKGEEFNQEKTNQLKGLIMILENIISQTDFSKLYHEQHRLFSIGFDIEENRLTDSYYDLLASEARQASLVAIAKKDISVKHWNSLSRTLTVLGKYKGLISWSGTAFEYLMPNINIPKFEGSLLDESCKFMVMSQMEYAKRLQIPWGISEAAFNLKDLHGNYQYKAFGIPWLGLKRGLADEMVVSSYGSILAITDYPKEVLKNMKLLEQYGMFGKFGLYESIDFTPERVDKSKKASVVKTYMAHHQSLILLSLNNLVNENILQRRFMENPEMEAVSILLQETMPEKAIITKENKEKVEKLKYQDYEDYSRETYTKLDERLVRGNVISNQDYWVAMNQKGEGISCYQNLYINRFKNTDDYPQGIFCYFKNIRTKSIWSSYHLENNQKYQISFMPDKIEQEMLQEDIKTKVETIVAPEEPVEIRQITLENLGNQEEIIEFTGYFEPVLSLKEQDYAHPAFNNLFLVFEFDEETKSLIVKRKKRNDEEKQIFLCFSLSTQCETIGDLEYEIDEEKFIGRGEIGIPQMVKNSNPLSKKIGLITEPVMALKRTMKVLPGQKTMLHLILAVGNTKEEAIENMKHYQAEENVKKTFELSKANIEAQSRYLGIKGKEISTYQKMLSYMIFSNPMKQFHLKNIPNQQYRQSDLWKFGISGDLPIILVKIKDSNDSYVMEEILKAYEFFRIKHFETEIVILDEEKHSYENFLKEEIENLILNHHMAYLKNIRGGIFELNKNELEEKDLALLEFVASLVIDSSKGSIENYLREMEEEYLQKYPQISNENKLPIVINENTEDFNLFESTENLKYYNEYGAFSQDGKEYWMRMNRNHRLPTVWSHIMGNEKFGTLVTESMGGYSWHENSRLNRVTSWENQPYFDIPTEIIYCKDEETKKTWSLGLNPMPDDKNYHAVYGFGYAKYLHKSDGIEQELEIFVPKEDAVKVQILTLKNTNPNKKKLKLVYYMKPVLGEDSLKSDGYISLNFDANSNIICVKNLYQSDFPKDIIYVSSSEKIKSYTGNKEFFVGSSNLADPDALRKVSLNNEDSLGRKACVAYEIEVELESFSQKEITFLLGAEESVLDCKNMAYKYSKVTNGRQELAFVKNEWENLIGRLQVQTPLESMNLLLNGWIIYQIIQSRLVGRTGFYQSGGAFGFRDQLQDTIALKYSDPERMKQQIIKHSEHQFIEGDVEHWWHEPTNRGIRTKFSDDLLWLPYLTTEYANFTGDQSIWEIETSFLEGEELEEKQDERYDLYQKSEEKGSIFEHCKRAIDRSLKFGEHGIPKIGSGDWNDGFSQVGNQGRGESVWLGFFLYDVLERFIPVCKQRKENELVEKYEAIKSDLKRVLNSVAWDGRWYRRAFMDNGNWLGSMENDECRIDSIAQTWSIISQAGDNDKKYISIESLENHLVDYENGIIKLLDPPFDKGKKLNPGYIKSYLPGVRENGGQYTHAAIWVIIAETMLGFGDKALEFYRMINPIEHARTKDAANKYKVEPYVIPADIYGSGNLAGRGGWTWYTGSASWYYKAGIESILGLKIENSILRMDPCIPKDWKEYKLTYRFGNSIYHIHVQNPNGKNRGVTKVFVNEREIENKEIVLDGNGNIYNILVIL